MRMLFRGYWLLPVLIPVLVGAASCGTLEAPAGPKPLATSHNDASDVIEQPLTDLNISHTEIPALLVQLEQAPYLQPLQMDCSALRRDIDQLTRLVGPDLENRKSTGNQAIVSKDSSTDTAWAAAHSAASSWIPFRGALRFITGADRQERRVNDAILAGFVRRAYLKGLRDQERCPSV